MATEYGKLYLIPNFLGNGNIDFLPKFNLEIIHSIDEFIVENEKPARAFLKSVQSPIHQNDFVFHFMGKHEDVRDFPSFLDSCLAGKNVGLISDAGLPCVADPGYQIVRLAHYKNIEVVPLVGFSSIMMALMASGFNGQSFKFHGYLPHNESHKKKKLQQALSDLNHNETQIFIETPYRNTALIAELKKSFPGQTKLCVAVDLSLDTENITTKALSDWADKEDSLHKRPAVFVLGL